MIKKFVFLLFLSIFTLHADAHFFTNKIAGRAPFDTPKPGSEEWYQYCNKWKNYYLTEPLYSVTYQSSSTKNSSSDYWLLKLGDTAYPLPIADYEKYLIRYSTFGIELVLQEKNGVKFVFRNSPIKKFVDIIGYDFGATGTIEENDYSSIENVILTKELFGGPVNSIEVTEQSLRHIPNEIRCSKNTINNDVKLFVLMTYKTSLGNVIADSNSIVANIAHDDKKGWSTKHILKHPNKFNWWSEATDDNFKYVMSISSPKDMNLDIHKFGKGLMNHNNANMKPDWVVKIQDMYMRVRTKGVCAELRGYLNNL